VRLRFAAWLIHFNCLSLVLILSCICV
jgi:hypothetical protein